MLSCKHALALEHVKLLNIINSISIPFYFFPPFLVVSGSTKGSPNLGTLQRSRSDVDVNAAAGAKARHAAGQTAGAGRLSATGLPPGSYASLGKGSTSALLWEVLVIFLIKKL